MSEAADTFFAHHGVKGQKWGVHRNLHGGVTSTGSRTATKPARKVSGDKAAAERLRSKRVSELSNKQLKTLTERQQLEQKYAQLNPSAITKGHNKVKIALAVIGTGVTIYNLANSKAGQDAIAVGRAAIGKQKNAGRHL